MLLIATDEAGYGPKLGPLVVAATAWKIPETFVSQTEIDVRFEPLRRPVTIVGQTVRVDDSKAVFKPGSGLAGLHAVVSASHHACGILEQDLLGVLARIAPQDVEVVKRSAWLGQLGDQPFLKPGQTQVARQAWFASGISLVDTRVRIIPARQFNLACGEGLNKADLLSESTIGLVRHLVDEHAGPSEKVGVYCDRHGGRRYYAGVLQHGFPEAIVQVKGESRAESAYRLTLGKQTVDIAFTVKGDSFTPVALASMHAKYLRERLMASLNAYFKSLHRSSVPFKPTAGYPVDADRFLDDVAATLARENIDRDHLVRLR